MNSSLFQNQQIVKRFASPQFVQKKQVRQQNFSCKAGEKAGTWLPGAKHPEYLDGSLPGDYGFDPLRLAENPADLQRFRVAELIHCRWAMLGAAGALAVEVLGYGNWYDAPKWVFQPGGQPTYFGVPVPVDFTFIVFVEVIAIAFVEMQRVYEQDPEKSAYPGGTFDPLGFSKNSKRFRTLQTNEVKNGRLAMLACAGFAFQHAVYGSTPIQNLKDHIADPVNNNFATNGVSLPQF